MGIWDVVGNRRWGYLLSLIVIVPGLVALVARGLNRGIDFTGGTLLELRLGQEASLAELRDTLRPLGQEDAVIQKSPGRPREVLIRTKPLSENETTALRQTLRSRYGDAEILRVERVGPIVGQELRRKAVLGVLVGLGLQVLYVSWRFRSLRFAVAGDIALIHDLLVVLGVFALARLEVDSSFVAVLLTVVGYSLYDTVVIFDRIRENLAGRPREPFPRLVNRSILEVLVRSLTTVAAPLMALLMLYFLGGPTLRNFVLGLGVGVITGSYSSIFVASPILVEWHQWDARRAGRSGAASGEQARETAPTIPGARQRRSRHRR